MKNLTAQYEGKASILKALAHPTRLLLVDKLAEREHCVCELTDLVGADISTVSKHLSVLKNAGIVADDKRGMMVFYSLKMSCVLKFMDCLESVLQKRVKEQLATMNIKM